MFVPNTVKITVVFGQIPVWNFSLFLREMAFIIIWNVNCIATILLAAGSERNNREMAPSEITDQVKRWASLGRETFEEKIGECTWEVALLIPYKVFFKHAITGLDGMSIRANFYKCGDELQKPHFLSWNPIKIEKPDFHRPDFFGLLEFE